jgi:hypothetical protein
VADLGCAQRHAPGRAQRVAEVPGQPCQLGGEHGHRLGALPEPRVGKFDDGKNRHALRLRVRARGAGRVPASATCGRSAGR